MSNMGVYALVNTENDKMYIGRSIYLDHRVDNHLLLIRKMKHLEGISRRSKLED